MLEEPQNEGALANWEGEGGSVSAASLDPAERPRGEGVWMVVEALPSGTGTVTVDAGAGGGTGG